MYRKQRGAERAQLIPGTENGVSPFLSADGQTLGFFTMDGALKKISLAGGAPITLVAQIEGVHRLGVWLIPDGTTRRQVSRGGGEEPRFSRSGTVLFFVAVGTPRVLFSADGYSHMPNRQQYDVAPGDDRFLMIKRPPAPPVPPVVMVEHWFTELRAKMKP